LRNGGFGTGTPAPWAGPADVIVSNAEAGGAEHSHSGRYFAWLGGFGTDRSDSLTQEVELPAGCGAALLSFWYHVDTSEPVTGAVDTFTVRVLAPDGAVLATVRTFTNRDDREGYRMATAPMRRFVGRTVGIELSGADTDPTRTGRYTTNFVIDDVALDVA